MIHVSTKRQFLLVCLSLLWAATCAISAEWPLKGEVDLSSGFGNHRSGRFHAGLDLRTGGHIGEKVFSPVDGYVWRVSMSYSGYGKGLYVKGDDDRLYVYGHLSALASPTAESVRQAQFAARRYYVDLYYRSDSLRVKKGELIALTGETGAGAPHLHFEVRSDNNRPLNPLQAGFGLVDKTAPTFGGISFQLTDDHSLFSDGSRRVDRSVRASRQGGFVLDTVLVFDSPFGVLVESWDRMRPAGMRQAVYRLSLEIDGRPYYQSVFDSLDFDWGPSANLEYDVNETSHGNGDVRRLFHVPGNRFPGSAARNGHHGLFGLDSTETFGLHTGIVRAQDFAGNRTELRFRFLWTPEGGPYEFDSTVLVDQHKADWIFRPKAGTELLGVDTVTVETLTDTRWRSCRGCETERLGDGRIRVRLPRSAEGGRLIRLVTRTHSGLRIPGPICETGTGTAVGRLHLATAMEDDGVIVSTLSAGTCTGRAQVTLFDGDTPVGVETAGYHTDGVHHYVFIPPRREYRRITRLDWQFVEPQVEATPATLDIDLWAVGFDRTDTLRVDDRFSVIVGPKTLYQPRFLHLARRDSVGMSRAYEIAPKVFVVREPFVVELTTGHPNPRAGLCWQQTRSEGWSWLLTDSSASGLLRGQSQGGGRFAALSDTVGPLVSRLNIKNGMVLQGARSRVTARVSDNLSGIGNDLSFTVLIDGQWLLPEFDLERGTLVAEPAEPLKAGKHTLSIVVVDRAGNKTELQRGFTVSAGRQTWKSK